MKSIILLAAFLFSAWVIFAQNKVESSIQPLKIGDTVPDIEFTNLINYHSKTARLSDFKDKLVILDFWATWCSACLQNFPKLDSLQRAYSEILKVILVNSTATGDSEKKVSDLFARLKTKDGQKYILPTVINDSIISSLFEHMIIPHYVWIFDGKVKAITSAVELTKENVLAFYNQMPIKLRMKKDVLDYDSQKPLFQNGNGGGNESILYRSMITGYIEGLAQGNSRNVNEDNLITKICTINSSIVQLYQQAFQRYVAKSRILLEVKDPSKVMSDSDWSKWKYDNTFCYEIVTPPITKENAYKRMQDDLLNFFGYSAAMSNRKVKCLILKSSGKGNKYDPTRKPENNLGEINVKNYIRNQHVSNLVQYLNNRLCVPVIDESGYNSPVDMDFDGDITNVEVLKFELNKFGFYIDEEERELDMFVLYEKNRI